MKKPKNAKTGSEKAATADAEAKNADSGAKPATASSSGRPPRHSRSTRKPITIDGEAKSAAKKPEAPAANAVLEKNDTDKVSASSDGNAKLKASADGAPSANKSESDKSSKPTKPAQAAAGSTTQAAKGKLAQHKKQSSGLFGKLVAAVIGGHVALGSAGALQYLGLLGTPGQADNGASAIDPTLFASADQLSTTAKALQARLNALESKTNGLSDAASASTDPAALDETIKTAVARAVSAQSSPTPADEAIATSLSAVQEQTGALAAQGDETRQTVVSLSQTLSTLKQDVTTLSSSISGGSAGEDAGLAALDGRLNDVTQQLTDLRSKLDGLAAVAAQVPATSPEVAGLVGGLETTSRDNATQIADLSGRLQQFEAALSAQTAQANRLAQLVTDTARTAAEKPMADLQAQVDARIAALGQEMQGQKQAVSALVEQSQNGADKKAARAIAAAALVNDINRGVPFVGSLNVMNQFVDDTQLAPLASFAQSGIATGAALSDQFSALRVKLVSVGTKTEAQSPLERLQSAALNLIKVQPLNAVEGDDAKAIASRISAALKVQDLAKAEAEWAMLPDESKTVSKEWHASLSARVLADTLLTSSIQSFVMPSEPSELGAEAPKSDD